MIHGDRYKRAQRKPIRPPGRKKKESATGPIYKWIFLVIVALALQGVALAGENTVVVKGDGFEVTVGDVLKFKEFTEKSGPYRTSPREYRDYMVKLKLFALEAEAMGITLPDKGSRSAEWSIEDLLSFRALYLEKLLEDTPLDAMVIQSYYSAFPEKFLLNSMDDGRMHLQPRDIGLGENVELLPLDDRLKEDIRLRIQKVTVKRVEKQAFERLSEKYNAHGCDPETERCEKK